MAKDVHALAAILVAALSVEAAPAKPAPTSALLTPLTRTDTDVGAGCYAYDSRKRYFFVQEFGDRPPMIRVRGKKITFSVDPVVDADDVEQKPVGAWTGRVLRNGNTTVSFRVVSERSVETSPETDSLRETDLIMTVVHDGVTDRRRLRMSCGS